MQETLHHRIYCGEDNDGDVVMEGNDELVLRLYPRG